MELDLLGTSSVETLNVGSHVRDEPNSILGILTLQNPDGIVRPFPIMGVRGVCDERPFANFSADRASQRRHRIHGPGLGQRPRLAIRVEPERSTVRLPRGVGACSSTDWVRALSLFSRNGNDFTDRFLLIPAAVLRLPVRSAAIDGELVACDGEDKPDFYALLRRPASGLCVWCFDLLMLNGRDLRTLRVGEAQSQAERAPRQDARRHLAALSHL